MSNNTQNSGKSLDELFKYVEKLAGLSRQQISSEEVIYADGDEKVIIKNWDGYDYCLVEYHIREEIEDLPCETVDDAKDEAETFVIAMQEKHK